MCTKFIVELVANFNRYINIKQYLLEKGCKNFLTSHTSTFHNDILHVTMLYCYVVNTSIISNEFEI